jgi:hypothetical protein
LPDASSPADATTQQTSQLFDTTAREVATTAAGECYCTMYGPTGWL